jgi:peroxiredoxin
MRIGFVGTGALLLAIAAFTGCSKEKPTFRARLDLRADAFDIVNWYSPMKMQLTSAPPVENLRLPETAGRQRKFGTLRLGTGPDTLVAVMIAEDPQAGRFEVYIDVNADGDLTNDGDGRWSEEQPTFLKTGAIVQVSYEAADSVVRVGYPLLFYRFKERLPNHLLYYRNGYRHGQIALEDTTRLIAIFDENADGRFDDVDYVMLVIDVDADGRLDGSLDSAELFEASKPFNIAGTTYEVLRISPMGDEIVLTVSDTTVAPKPYIAPGHLAPEFTMTSLSGQEIRLSDFRGKVVLLDFWATWCNACIVELPNVLRTYREFKDQGFEIIGLSLDEDRERLVEFISKQDIGWPQLFDGKGWKMEIAQLYRVSSLPATFLLDRSGTIRYKNVRGSELARRVQELLAEGVSD